MIFLLKGTVLSRQQENEGGEWKGVFVLLRGLRTILTWVTEHYQRIKSPNGTFVNGERLRPDIFKSQPHKAKSANIRRVSSPPTMYIPF